MADLTPHTGSSSVRKHSRLVVNSEGVQVATIAADVTITPRNPNILRINGGVADRSLTASAALEAIVQGGTWRLINSGTTNSLLWKSAAAATIVTVPPGQQAIIYRAASTWYGHVMPAASSAGATQIADGTVLLPGLAFALDTDNGLYRIGANNYALGVAGAIGLELAATYVKSYVAGALIHTVDATGVVLAGTLDLNGALDLDKALTGTGDAANIAMTINHASQIAEALDITFAQLTTPRTSNYVAGIRLKGTSLATDSAGVHYPAVKVLAPTDGGVAGLFHGGLYADAGNDYAVQAEDSVYVGFGTGVAGAPDATMRWDGTILSLLPLADDSVYKIGNGTLCFDVWIYGADANTYISWDASSSDLKLEDGVSLMFGTGAGAGPGTAGDVEIRWDGTDLDVLAAADDLVMKIGNGTNSFDVWIYGNTASDYVEWDASVSTLFLRGAAGLTVVGSSILGPVSSPMTAAQDVATGNTITLPATGMFKALTATAGAATGVILTVGTVAGQMIYLANAHATNAITFDATPATSKVARGTTALVAGAGMWFAWNATTGLWQPS
mgnify:CR=1 FL=1